MNRLLFTLLGLGTFLFLWSAKTQVDVDYSKALSNSIPETQVNAAGQLDPTFGSGGIVTTDFGTNADAGKAVAVQSDGKIILAGSLYNGSNGDIGLARYLSNGSLDPTFGNNGKVVTDINGRHDQANAMLIQPDGRIVVAGASYLQSTNEQDFLVLRYHADGTLDPTFSGDGWTLTDMGANFDTVFALVLQPDGKIAAAGTAENNGQADIAIARYQSDGGLDTSFDGDGKVVTNLGSSFDWASGAALQADGKIVVSGLYHNGSTFDFAAVRYQTNGALDPAFDTDGIVITDINLTHNQAHAILIQSDGKIVVGGYSFATPGNDGLFTMVRYNTNGSPDLTFGSGGIVQTPVGTADVGNALALQADGKYYSPVTVGTAQM